MKQINIPILFILILFSGVSCSESSESDLRREKMIVNHWVLSKMTTDMDRIPPEKKENAAEMLERMKGKMVFVIKDDSSYSMKNTLMGFGVNGKWALNSSQDSIVLRPEGKDEVEYQAINYLSSDSLVIGGSKFGEAEMVMEFRPKSE